MSGGPRNISQRHKVLPLATRITPSNVQVILLNLYIFSVLAVDAVCAVYSVLAVDTVCAVYSVLAVDAVCTVYSVIAVDAVLAVNTVGTIFSRSARKLGNCYQITPVAFVTVFPLDGGTAVSYLRPFCRA